MNSVEQLERFYTNEASIRDLEISQRSVELLEENNIKSIADLQANFGSLLNIAGMDTTRLQEINQRYNQWLRLIARGIVFLKSESTNKRTSWLDRIPPGIELNEVEIEYLGLSIKTYNTLARAGITSLADIAPYNDDFMQIKARNFGPKAAEELLEKIEQWLQRPTTNETGSLGRFKFRSIPRKSNDDDYPKPTSKAREVSIYELKLSNRARHLLLRNKISTISQLIPKIDTLTD